MSGEHATLPTHRGELQDKSAAPPDRSGTSHGMSNSQIDIGSCLHNGVDYSTSGQMLFSDGDNGDVLSNLPRITVEDEESESRSLSNEERLLAFADLYGRTAPGELERERQLEAFDWEMSRLPVEQKAALHRGYTVNQARLFLDIEGNDARHAVERMATYWEKRFKLLGNDAFSEEPGRTQEDFRRVYKMASEVTTDPEVNKETRRWAERFIGEWNRGHIQCLDEELGNIPPEEKSALMEALERRPDIASSDEHKLLFLRCEDFDVKLAARRMVKYWKSKFEIFGSEGALLSAVTVSDLMKDHPQELSAGFFWNMPGTDAFGRGVVFFESGDALKNLMQERGGTDDGLLKVTWYILHAAMEEKSCLENGIVLLIDRQTTPPFSLNLISRKKFLWFDSLPCRIKAVHMIAPPRLALFRVFLPFFKWLIGKRMRMRLCVHTGTREETIADLEEFGISKDLVPKTLGGNVDISRLGRAWLEERKEAGL